MVHRARIAGNRNNCLQPNFDDMLVKNLTYIRPPVRCANQAARPCFLPEKGETLSAARVLKPQVPATGRARPPKRPPGNGTHGASRKVINAQSIRTVSYLLDKYSQLLLETMMSKMKDKK